MKILKGISLAPGIAEGIISLYVSEIEKLLPHYSINSAQIPGELNRFNESIRNAVKIVKQMIGVSEKRFDKETKEIFSAHLSILNDQELSKDITNLIKTKRLNAEHAIHDIFEKYIKEYQTKGAHYRELIHDFIDIRNRLLETFNISTGRFQSSAGKRQPIIVATKHLTPSMVLNIQRKNVLAFILEEAGITSHAVILARSYGVPIIFGINVEKELQCGMKAIVDGLAGEVIVDTSQKEKEYYRRKMHKIRMKKELCKVAKNLPVCMENGQRITMKINISAPEEFSFISKLDHDGIGLLRTEFLFMQRDTLPSEEEQYVIYQRFLEQTPEKPVTVRLLDMAEDKFPAYFKLPHRIHHDLGFRGALAVEMFPETYLTQVKALLRANREDCNSNLRLVYPMVSDLSDVKTFREVVKNAKKILRKEGAKFSDKNIKEGIMIETPAAVMMAEELLKEVDFANVGSNDLLQYALAASRGSPAVERRYHIFHPAVAKLLRFVAEAGEKLKKEVCLCGEISSFEEFYPLLLQIGIRSFSIAVSRFTDIKCGLLPEILHLHESRGIDIITDFHKVKSKEEADSYFRKLM